MNGMKILALCAAMSLASTALAHPSAEVSPRQGEPHAQQQQNKGVAITAIVVAEIDSLPQEVRKEVDAQISNTPKEELDAIRRSLSGMPAASNALDAKGKSIKDVVAVSLSADGALLLVTTTAV